MAKKRRKICYTGYSREMHKAERRRKDCRSALLIKPMNLKEMAEEYRVNAGKLKKHIDKLKAQNVTKLSYGERVTLQAKINYHEALLRETLSTAKYLDEYYQLQNR